MTWVGIGIIIAIILTIFTVLAGQHLKKPEYETNIAIRGSWILSALIAFAGWCIWPNL